ncbi:hypothetical protein [Thermaerobacillus caldiproteolyticus]|uniref:hypothetical protein n=1 Tax=Thermaerobacillus caldiproteolyticus TaxID=247480 RepID=UPI00188D202D|nr:hypothetical protein [Anoxybacillus caldiproteolyticus]QPA32227.1 hypothetical protein ISX45_04365 [Anoxybacillus caldiproteolyticus]
MRQHTEQQFFKLSVSPKNKRVNFSQSYENLLHNKENHTPVLFRTNSEDSILGYIPLRSDDLKDYSIQVKIVKSSYIKSKRDKRITALKERVDDIVSDNYLFVTNYLELLKIFDALSFKEKRRVIQKLVQMFKIDKESSEFPSNVVNNEESKNKQSSNTKKTRVTNRKVLTDEERKKELMKRAFIEADQFYRGYNSHMDFYPPKNEYFAGTGSNMYRRNEK